MRPTIVIAAALAAAALAHAPAQAAPVQQGAPAAQQSAPAWEQPSQVIETAARQLLNALKGHRQEYRKDPAKVTALVDKYLLPHVDTQLAAQLVLGRYWRTATAQQRQRFIDAFYHSMMVNFGGALADFRSDMLKVYPTHLRPGTDFATVRTEMTRSNGSRVSVVYLMQLTPRGWQAFDVHIDGVSYVKSYREDFAEQIRQQGLDEVIKRLQAGARPDAIAHAAGGS